jgi:PucR family transcriptional regulator, purine catabolism regulatory protein
VRTHNAGPPYAEPVTGPHASPPVVGAPTTEGSLTVRDLLAVPALGLRLLAAPERIDTALRWAHPTELLDPRGYLAGGELVLTVGASLAGDPTRCDALVDRLVEVGASALGYGVGDVTEEVPDALVEACRRHGLPLLRVPSGVPFQAITEMLADRRAEARAGAERRTQRLSTRLLDGMAADLSLEALLEVVAADLGGRVTYDDARLHWEPTGEADVAPPESTLQHLGSVLAVRKHEQDVELAHRRAETGRLLRLVSEGKADAAVLRDALLEAGVAAEQGLVVAAWPAQAVGLLASALAGRALLLDGPDAVLSVTTDAERTAALAVELTVPCGSAAPCSVDGLASAVPAALAALDLSRRRGAPATHRDLVSFEGLLEQQPHERVQPFAETLLQPLVEHDREHGTALLRTLRAFVEGDGSVIATARDLHLHPNSLRYRLKRVAELTGADPRVFSDRVALAVGLWAWDRRPRGRR